MKDKINDFLKEREEVFSSMDEKRIRDYCKKYEIDLPRDENIFWAAVHKVICQLFLCEDTVITPEQFNASHEWLIQHGFTTDIQ